MTKKEFIEFMIQVAKCGVEKVYVYRFPDFCGGYQHRVTLHEIHDDFTYKVFDGDLDDIFSYRDKTFLDHYEPFHERPYDVSVTLEELVIKFFTRP